MLCEAFRKLEEFGRLDLYRYIGFGSTFFSDFILFHKALKIHNNISIESNLENQERFNFNKPYSCVDLRFGKSKDILPSLPWGIRTIVWLDYDEMLDDDKLADISFVSSMALSGSMLIMSLNAQPNNDENKRIMDLNSRIEKEKIPLGLNSSKLGSWGTAEVFRKIILNEIAQSLQTRNGGRIPGSKFQFKQLFNFHYRDGAKMLTVGGIIYDEGQENLLAKAAFENLSFVRTGDEAYTIDVPSLTLKELHYLDKQLPCERIEEIDPLSIPVKDIEKYSKIYRYFPGFVDAEIG